MLVITAFLCKVITFKPSKITPAIFHLMAEEATKCRLISKQKKMNILLLNITLNISICCQNHLQMVSNQLFIETVQNVIHNPNCIVGLHVLHVVPSGFWTTSEILELFLLSQATEP
jgi:hypothetical protein